MSVKTQHPEKNSPYFCTVTCYKWLPLFELTNFYPEIYKWFRFLAEKRTPVSGFVLMPNHFHVIIYLTENTPSKSVNSIIANGKRFMAYEIVRRLAERKEEKILFLLKQGVSKSDSKKGKIHQVFEPSFDGKICETEKFISQKLDYMHKNPVKGKWQIVNEYISYPHSSAIFYEEGILDGFDFLKDYREII